MYAFVDVQQYQIVGIGDTVNAAMANFESVLGGSEEAPVGEPVTGILQEILPVVVDGNTRYYFRLEGARHGLYRGSVPLQSPALPPPG